MSPVRRKDGDIRPPVAPPLRAEGSHAGSAAPVRVQAPADPHAAVASIATPNASGTGAPTTLFSDTAPGALSEPSAADRLRFMQGRLASSGMDAATIRTLDTHARDGLYLLSVGGVDPQHIARFMGRSPHPAQFLELVTYLYNAGVTGFEKAFQPGGIDDKLLSADKLRIRSTFTELFQGLQSALLVADARVQLYPELSIDWRRMPAEFQSVLNDILPGLPNDMQQHYADQNRVEADAIVATNGSRWLLEVKSSTGVYSPTGEELAKLRLQALRLALVAQQQGLNGVEYVIDGDGISTAAAKAIAETLKPLKVPFLIRVSSADPAGTGIKVNGELSYLAIEQGLPTARSRALPQLPTRPARAPSSATTPADEEADRDPIEGLWKEKGWRREVGKVLRGWLEDSKRLADNRSWLSFVKEMGHSLPPPERKALKLRSGAAIDAALEATTDSVRRQTLKEARRLWTTFHPLDQKVISQDQIRILTQIAALVAGQPIVPVTESAEAIE